VAYLLFLDISIFKPENKGPIGKPRQKREGIGERAKILLFS
jgi:hypothetical protein